MEANRIEIETSRALCLLEELGGKAGRPEKSHWDGYHPNAYGKANRGMLDHLTCRLCERLQRMDDKAIRTYSLEMQLWWRDHQEADRQRVERELADAADEKAREAAIAKLTQHERDLLNLT